MNKALAFYVLLVAFPLGAAETGATAAAPTPGERLEWFKDQKLGLMMHFGLYSEVGIIESWPLSDADSYWSRKEIESDVATNGFKEAYYGLNRSFNPVRFRPKEWADEAVRGGFKYVIFTTKHHDGFCLYDSKYTDYKTTHPACPFSTDPRADITKHLFDAFRERGLGIGAYFSKPDWHHDDYWENSGIGRQTDRAVSYDTAAHPEKWDRFKRFFRNQVLELVRGYGPIDILWLDGGWVSAKTRQDLEIASVVAEARKTTPGLMAVNRHGDAVGDGCEDVKTPEQFVPGKMSEHAWESCITISGNWGYHYDDVYKSPRELVHTLVDVVAKGGNLALNVGPAPDGRLPRPAVERMRELGAWLDVNGRAIYSTRPAAPYRSGDWAYTCGKNGVRYAIMLWPDCMEVNSLSMRINPSLANVRSFRHLATGAVLPARRIENPQLGENVLAFDLPEGVRRNRYADAFAIEE